jgi:predicted transcriptional regulator
MERVSELFFELSNEDRLNILFLLEKEALKLTHLSKKLDLTSSEVHRQLSRLSDAKLISKNVEGFHFLTPYGKQCIRWISGYKFISENRDYFQSHSFSQIPNEYLNRLGELSESIYIDDALISVSNIESMIKNAHEYILIIHDQFLLSAYPLASDAINRGVTIKTIDPVFYRPSVSIRGKVDEKDQEILSTALKNERLLNRQLESFDVFMWMSETETSILSFPDLKGKFDYTGFTSKDTVFIKWCRNLFDYYWIIAKPKQELTFTKPY